MCSGVAVPRLQPEDPPPLPGGKTHAPATAVAGPHRAARDFIFENAAYVAGGPMQSGGCAKLSPPVRAPLQARDGDFYPEPIRISRKGDRWLREDLDEAIERLTGKSTVPFDAAVVLPTVASSES